MRLSMPASSMALRAALACNWSVDWLGMTPTVSVSAAPIMAICLRRSAGIVLRSLLRRLELGQRDLVVHVLKHHLDRHAGRQVFRLDLGVDDVGHQVRAFGQL